VNTEAAKSSEADDLSSHNSSEGEEDEEDDIRNDVLTVSWAVFTALAIICSFSLGWK
jgi:hypothetical protein